LSGENAIYGISVRNAAQMAVDEINAAGGLANGVLLELEMVDDQNNPDKIPALYQSLYANGMNLSMGTVTTTPGRMFKEMAKADNLFVLTPSASGDAIVEYANAYQMCFADSEQGIAVAELINEAYTGKTVGVLYQSSDASSSAVYSTFMTYLSRGLKPEESNVISFASPNEAILAEAAAELSDCDVIFMPIGRDAAAAFIQAAKSTVSENAVFLGCDGFFGLANVVGFDVNTVPQEIFYLSQFDSFATEGPVSEFIKRYHERYDESAEPLHPFGAAAYDCVYALRDALNIAIAQGHTINGNIKTEELCEILKGIFRGGFEFYGITGAYVATNRSKMTWDENGMVQKDPVRCTVKAAGLPDPDGSR